MPRCAMSALSMFRTVCFGVTSDVVSTWISSTAPLSLAMMRAAITPGSVANNSSARLIGRTLPAMRGEECGSGCGTVIRGGGEPGRVAAQYGGEGNTLCLRAPVAEPSGYLAGL